MSSQDETRSLNTMKNRKPHPPRLSARTSDKHSLYEQAVQTPESEVAFIDRVYRKRYGRPATILREDFCGTALVACAWAVRRRANVAYGVDLDKPTLDWGYEHNVSMLPEHAIGRVHLVNADVLHVTGPQVEVIAAMNYSYFLFREFDRLVQYFSAARRSLVREGLLVLDAFGGYDAQRVMQDAGKHDGFTYVWDQAEYNPVNDHCTCHIHFRFPDGTRMQRAFTYHWRLWTLGGIRDALRAAGFQSSAVYWEGDDGKGGGNGIFRRAERAENCRAWNAYIVAGP